jgi:Tfp pilus assembly protein PilV
MAVAARSHNQGFVMLEAIAAVFVVLVGIFSVLQFFDYGVRKLKAEEESRIALRQMRNELEILRAQPFDTLVKAPSDQWLGERAELDMLVDHRTRVEVEPGAEAPTRLMKVTVSIRWRGEYGRPIQRKLTTLIAGGTAP